MPESYKRFTNISRMLPRTVKIIQFRRRRVIFAISFGQPRDDDSPPIALAVPEIKARRQMGLARNSIKLAGTSAIAFIPRNILFPQRGS